MRKFNKVFTAFVLILAMVMVLAGCTKKDEEERSSRRERRNRTEKEEEEEDISTTVPTETEITPAEQATAVPATPEPTEEIILRPTEEATPEPTAEVTPEPTLVEEVPINYIYEFKSVDDLKFIRAEILGKNLDEAIDIVNSKMNASISKDEGRFVLQNGSSLNSYVYYDLDRPGVKILGSGGFKTVLFDYRHSETDPYTGIVTGFEFCLNGSEKEDKSVTPEVAESAFLQIYHAFVAYLGEPTYTNNAEDKFWDNGALEWHGWSDKKLGNIWFCWGADLWGNVGNNDCLLSFSLDESEIPTEDTENSDVEEYFKISKKTGFLWMDTSIWNVSYKVFTKLMGDAEITELQDWPHWGTGLQAAFLTDGKYEYACLFQKDKLVQVYMDLDEDMSSKVYDAAVKKYGNPYNAYMYWSGYPAYEWTVTNGTYQQHMEVYDEKNHYRQMYVSPDYTE